MISPHGRRRRQHHPSSPANRGDGAVIIPVSFCVSWRRVFVLVTVFYLVLFTYVLLLVGESQHHHKADDGDGVMHQMLRSIFHDGANGTTSTTAKAVEDKIKSAERAVESVIERVQEELNGGAAAALADFVAHPSGHSKSHEQRAPLAPVIAKVDDDHATRLADIESKLGNGGGDGTTKLRSCRWRDHADGGYYGLDDTCHSSESVTYYNPHPTETRIVCDQSIGPNSQIVLAEPCPEPSRMFPVVPDRTAKGLPPVTLGFDRAEMSKDKSHGDTFTDCDVPCRNRGEPGIVCTRYVDGTDWSFTFSMEGPEYYGNLRIDPDAYKAHRYYSTTSYLSDVPLPYYSWAEYKIHVPGVQFDDAIKAAVFLARNCASQNNRESIIKQLEASKVFRVDSLSSCLHNAEPPPGVSLHDKKAVMGKYLFYLAFENQNVDDYITEKLWGPFEAGTVPVYFGAPNVKEHVPANSIIDVRDFATVDDLAAHLNRVAHNKTLYESYQAWRSQPLPPNFHAKYDFTHIHSTCRTCRWAHAKLYGLGWDHFNQSLRELTLDRTACTASTGLVTRPFVETWRTATGRNPAVVKSAANAASCQINNDNRRVMIGSSLQRTIWEKDGVIDLEIHGIALNDVSYLLDMSMPLVGATQVLVTAGHVRFQTNETRITVLTMPRGALIAKSGGSLVSPTLPIRVETHQLPLRVRVVVEDVDTLHRGADQVENYFGSRMIEDFYNPIEAFVAAA